MRNYYVKITWVVYSTLIIITVSVRFFGYKPVNSNYQKTTAVYSESSFSPVTHKYVTKSMSQLGKMDDVNPYLLFFNSVPYSGSEALILLLQKLQGINNYRHVRLKEKNPLLSLVEQNNLISTLENVLKDKAVPLSFDRQAHFMNFKAFGKQSPTYIGLIRDPVDKIISRSRSAIARQSISNIFKCLSTGKGSNKTCTLGDEKYDFSVPYFCGHNPRCMVLNSEWALHTAKTNVHKYYQVVGVLEQLNNTLKVLEHKIPFFFHGVEEIYEKDFPNKTPQSVKTKTESNTKTKKVLNNLLVTEYKFYKWIKTRLLTQLSHVVEHTFDHKTQSRWKNFIT